MLSSRALPVTTAMCADCIFSEWAGLYSPLLITNHNTAVVNNTVFHNTHLAVEVADVSYGGSVRFHNVSFANVTLKDGKVVSTTSGQDEPLGCKSTSLYYPEGVGDYDVEVTSVPQGDRSMWGEEFVVRDSTMSDCLYLLAPEDFVMPGCPNQSADTRQQLLINTSTSVAAVAEICPQPQHSDADFGSTTLRARIPTLSPERAAEIQVCHMHLLPRVASSTFIS